MKKLFFLLVAICCCAAIYAQQENTSIRLRLSDGTLMSVAVNGRYFEKTGYTLTIGDLPARKIHIKVYRFRPYADGSGGKAELLYSGTLRIEKGKAYDGVVDVSSRRLLLKKINPAREQMEKPRFPSDRDQPLNVNEPSVSDKTELRDGVVYTPELIALKKKMDEHIADGKKLSVATKEAPSQLTALEATQIASWFFFDATKMKFAKMIYLRITDKEHLSAMAKVFTEKSSKAQFQQFLKEQK